MYAVVKFNGKQHKVCEGDMINFDRVSSVSPKDKLELKEVMAVNKDGKLDIGAPFLKDAVVVCSVVSHGRDKKVITLKKRRRKDSKTKRGFRRDYTRVKIEKINA